MKMYIVHALTRFASPSFSLEYSQPCEKSEATDSKDFHESPPLPTGQMELCLEDRFPENE